jgi:hypothetical protein
LSDRRFQSPNQRGVCTWDWWHCTRRPPLVGKTNRTHRAAAVLGFLTQALYSACFFPCI